jgi:hypothetical protein
MEVEQKPKRKVYVTDVGDDEWAFCAPYLTLMTEDAPQRNAITRCAKCSMACATSFGRVASGA